MDKFGCPAAGVRGLEVLRPQHYGPHSAKMPGSMPACLGRLKLELVDVPHREERLEDEAEVSLDEVSLNDMPD